MNSCPLPYYPNLVISSPWRIQLIRRVVDVAMIPIPLQQTSSRTSHSDGTFAGGAPEWDRSKLDLPHVSQLLKSR